MRPTTLVRLALAGTRTDTVRVALTAFSACLAVLAMLAAATVIAIPTFHDNGNNRSPQYRNALLAEAGLRPGVVVALVLLTIPVLALAAQCARLGAPARDRRLAAIRLAGGTPPQAVAIAATETGMASALGSVAGLGLYLGGRQVLHRPGADGMLALPTDVLPSMWALAAITAGLPLVAALVAVALMRRVAVTPFGVVRRARTGRPKPWPGVLLAVGVGIGAAIFPLYRRFEGLPSALMLLLAFLALLLATVGTVTGTGWISHWTGRMLHRFGRGPAALLAARRLMADPWSGSRILSALLGCLVFAGGAAGVRASFAAEFDLREEMGRQDAAARGEPYYPQDTDFYFRAFDLINVAVAVALIVAAGGLVVALAESIVSRRRAYAALVATGVPRGTLARAVLWQSLAPAVQAVALALAVGWALSYGIFHEVQASGPVVCTAEGCPQGPRIVRSVPVPLDDLALYGAGAAAVLLAVVGVGLLFLRASTALEELRV
ncbi:FtsX-like permease family protein [Phytohabitans kaempferiae]|uniref:FtsX-like permease family protein n=1 Tax=Phytohabitans kaempferiae TaxID=1620943 RepID=A0ABV6LV20_9ACTN